MHFVSSFEAFMAVEIRIATFSVMVTCILIGDYHHFGKTCLPPSSDFYPEGGITVLIARDMCKSILTETVSDRREVYE
jgi:hypothetical protein